MKGGVMTPPNSYRGVELWIDVLSIPHVILSERSESKDLRTDLNANVSLVRRSLGSISFRSG